MCSECLWQLSWLFSFYLCSAVALAVPRQALHKTLLLLLRAVVEFSFSLSFIHLNPPDCPKALLPLAIFGSFWQLGCGDVSKNMLKGLKVVAFSSSHKAPVGERKYCMRQA